jgi:hypothetical protein
MTPSIGRLAWIPLAVVAALSSPPLPAAEPPPETPPEESLTPTPGLEEIDEILAGEEEALAGGGDVYDAGDRRDPFKSLLVVTDQPALEGPRPEGIPGLLIDEVVLSGIFRTREGYIAQVQAADRQKSYLLKAGDQLFDGDVIAINRNEVVFRQNVQDPTALKPFREVVKALNPP